jgi:hypothetical protein
MLYYSPTGEVVFDATIEQVVAEIRDKNSPLCNGGPGVVHLGRGTSSDPSITLLHADGYGWFVEANILVDGIRRAFTPVTGTDLVDVARVWTGEDWMRIPRAFFVDTEAADRIVTTFSVDGGLDKCVTWKRDLDWECRER